MIASKILTRVCRRNVSQQVRKAHDVQHHDKYLLKAAKCYTEDHVPYKDIGYGFPLKCDNPYKLWLQFVVFFGSGFWLPFASYHYSKIK